MDKPYKYVRITRTSHLILRKHGVDAEKFREWVAELLHKSGYNYAKVSTHYGDIVITMSYFLLW